MANYLPLLLVSVSANAVPDDSALATQPAGQVDYLSHHWQEEDVWRSWRSMTRQKHEIANGMRLENASWRTWWKQRNKLKTISPETLNWLKDSDVTWLYGPLHTAIDWAPPPKPKADPDTVDKVLPAHARLDLHTAIRTCSKKPILKHRSTRELLQPTLPPSPSYEGLDEVDDYEEEEEELELAPMEGPQDAHGFPARPPLMHTKSDSHIMRWRKNHQAFRKDSPPRVPPPVPSTSASALATPAEEEPPVHEELTAGPSGRRTSTTPESEDAQPKKKHISFNAFVEQCIAIDSPQAKSRTASMNGRGPRLYQNAHTAYPERFDEEDSEEEQEQEEAFDPSASESEEDEVLEIRLRSRSSSSSASARLSPSTGYFPRNAAAGRPPLVRTASSEKEHVTIAPIAPTMLKSAGVESEAISAYVPGVCAPSPGELVYVPRVGSSYSLLGSAGSAEDVYHHPQARFSVGGGGADYALPSAASSSDLAALGAHFFGGGLGGTPASSARGLDGHDLGEPDAYDYFDGPDFDEEYAERRSYAGRRRRSITDQKDDDDGGGSHQRQSRFAEGAGNTHATARSRSAPAVVVNDAPGMIEGMMEHSSSGEDLGARVRTPSPDAVAAAGSPLQLLASQSAPVPVPRSVLAHVSTSPTQARSAAAPSPRLLSPPDASRPARGRGSCPSSTAGSTTTGSRGFSSDSRSESRGRSSTRTSSFSDRERSGSRGAGSPLGSLSPSGSLLGVAGSYGSAYGAPVVRERGRDSRTGSRASSRANSSESLSGVAAAVGSAPSTRGRDRATRRLSESLSPPNAHASPPARAGVLDTLREEERSTSSGSSTRSGVSSTTVAPHAAAAPSSAQQKDQVVEEEDAPRGRNPTPANSPVLALKRAGVPHRPPPPGPARPSTTVSVSPPSGERSPSTPTSPASPTGSSNGGRAQKEVRPATRPEHPRRTSFGEQEGLVGRAIDVVSTARGFLGSLWHP